MFKGITKALGVTKVTDEQHDADMKKHKKGPYSLPPEENDDPKSVYVEECGRKYRISTLADFKRFKDLCNDSEGWTERYASPMCTVYDKAPEKGKPGDSLNLIKVVNMFPRTSPKTLYHALHDNHYRKSWDTSMLEGFNICQLDPRNDIGYYAVQSPWPLHNREFINMRCWMEFDNGEFCIINRSVLHDDYPLTQKFVRGVSYFSGYYIAPLGGDAETPGCKMIFFTHGDIQGAVPHNVTNMIYSKMCPSIMTKLEENSFKYPEWVKKFREEQEAEKKKNKTSEEEKEEEGDETNKNNEEEQTPEWQTAVVSWEAEKNAPVYDKVLKIVKEKLTDETLKDETLKDLKKEEVNAKLQSLKKKLQNAVDGDDCQLSKAILHDVVEYKKRRNKALKQQPASSKEFLESLVPILEGIKKCCALE